MYFWTTWTIGHQKLETVIWKLHQKKKDEHDKFVAAIYHEKRVEGQKTWVNNFISFVIAKLFH